MLTPTETIYVIEGHEYDDYQARWTVEAPNERVQAAMDALLADFDGARCQMENCHKADQDGAPVGWGLVSDSNTGYDRATSWYTALIDTGTEVYRACEDCHMALSPRRTPDAQHPAEALHSR